MKSFDSKRANESWKIAGADLSGIGFNWPLLQTSYGAALQGVASWASVGGTLRRFMHRRGDE
ncbi:hypothetical protein NKH57_33475 [Mesorhizobium sp. M1050]|uniref:hypothetical protein n=1 Tax=Mesorhizobium sp. M1050 TaxID=2957051 RepID=UPI003334BE3E